MGRAMTGRVAGKVALVTGGASGLGRASAAALAREGALTYVADLDEAAGLAHCAQITAAGGTAHFIRLDVTDEASWTAAIATIAAKSGALDILLNNAGICILKPLSAFSLADWRRLMAVNLDGVFLGTRAALPLLGDGGGGSIINMSSAAGKMAAPMMAAYSASKGGVIMFTRAMALECAQLGLKIRVNAICPGGVATPLWAKLTNDGYLPDAGVTTEDMAEKRRWTEAITPLGFAGEPEDIAHGVIYLASDEARFVTGTELVIDGGNTAGQKPSAY